MIKDLLPHQLKVSINLAKNQIIDLLAVLNMPLKNDVIIDYTGDVEITQEIKNFKNY